MKQVYINTLDIPSIQRFAVGFDRMFDELSRTAGTLNASNYPPYNIIKESETIWKIEVAVAGFDESELDLNIGSTRSDTTGMVVPALTANIVSTINYAANSGGIISFRNDTPGSPGNTASFGAQQLYNFQWGDGTANSNINIQSGLAGNPGASNITHTFALSAGQQTAGTTVTYTANLWLYTGFSTSPFKSANITITVEPEVRANFLGTANTQSDATGSTAQTGYIYTDYNGNNRAIFSFQNSSQHGNLFNWNFGDPASGSSNVITTTSSGTQAAPNASHIFSAPGCYTVSLTATSVLSASNKSNCVSSIAST